MPTKYNRRRQRKSRKSRKSRNQRGGVLSPDTIRKLRDQYYETRLPGGAIRPRPLPNLMQIKEFVDNNNIHEPFHEVVSYIRLEILQSFLAPIPEPENNIEEFREEVRRLAELARPPLAELERMQARGQGL